MGYNQSIFELGSTARIVNPRYQVFLLILQARITNPRYQELGS